MSEETHNINTSVAQPTETVVNPKQAVAPVKVPEPVKPQTTQTTETVASPKQPAVSGKTTDTIKPQPTGNTISIAPAPTKTVEPVKPPTAQPTKTVKAPEPTKTQAIQSTATVKAPDTVKPQTTQPSVAVKTTEPAKTQSTVPTAPAPTKTAEPAKPQTVQPTETAQEPVKPQITQPTEVPKLSDVIPTSKVWISGLIGNRQIDCLGPIEIPLKIDRPTYPFTPVPANSDYTNQVFNYDTSTWVPTDAKSQGQQLTDLTKEVADLQQTITKHEKDAETSQAISLQQMQMLMSITAKLDALTKKEGVK